MRILLSFIILPFSFCVLLAIAGILVRTVLNRRTLGNGLLIGAAALLLWFSSYPGAYLLMTPLERKYEPLIDPESVSAQYVAVLGGGINYDTSLPVTARLTPSSTRRLAEGIRIRNLMDNAMLILLGGFEIEGSSTAGLMLENMIALDADTSNVVLLPGNRNTADEARAVREYAVDGPVILVTSAWHMPRSVALFRGQNIEVIPAPSDHALYRSISIGFKHFIWSPEYLNISHTAFHEYVGILWGWLRGKMGK